MNDVPFYQTKAGRRFYESTMPELVHQLTRLNDLLTRYLDRAEAEAPPPAEETEDESR